MSFPIIEKAKRQAYLCFVGLAIPCDKRTVDGGTIRSEKVLKFNRSAMRDSVNVKAEKVDPRMGLGEDTMASSRDLRIARLTAFKIRGPYFGPAGRGWTTRPSRWSAT